MSENLNGFVEIKEEETFEIDGGRAVCRPVPANNGLMELFVTSCIEMAANMAGGK